MQVYELKIPRKNNMSNVDTALDFILGYMGQCGLIERELKADQQDVDFMLGYWVTNLKEKWNDKENIHGFLVYDDDFSNILQGYIVTEYGSIKNICYNVDKI